MQIDISKKIGDLLIDKKLHNQGLMYGKMGLSVFFYHLAQKYSEDKYNHYAGRLVDEVFQQLTPLTGLKDGIAGIGWGIEYLIQHDFCEGDADEILDDIDSRIFKVLIESKEATLKLENGLTGYLQYYLMRLKNKKGNPTLQREINEEIFQCIINEIDSIAPKYFINLTQDYKFDLFNEVYILLDSLNRAYDLHICNDKIKNMFLQWEIYFTSYLPHMQFNRLYLATLLHQVNAKILQSEKVDKHIKTILYSLDLDVLRTEIDTKEITSIRSGYLGLLFLLDQCKNLFNANYPNYENLLPVKKEIIELCQPRLLAQLEEDIENENKMAKHGITDGWGGVGLLSLLRPEIMNMDE